MTWADSTLSINTLYNFRNRMLILEDTQDAQGGIDFIWRLRASNGSYLNTYISINSADPLAITSGMSTP